MSALERILTRLVGPKCRLCGRRWSRPVFPGGLCLPCWATESERVYQEELERTGGNVGRAFRAWEAWRTGAGRIV